MQKGTIETLMDDLDYKSTRLVNDDLNFNSIFPDRVQLNLHDFGFHGGLVKELRWTNLEDEMNDYLKLSGKESVSYFFIFPDSLVMKDFMIGKNKDFKPDPFRYFGIFRNPNLDKEGGGRLLFYELDDEKVKVDITKSDHLGFQIDRGLGKKYFRLAPILQLPFSEVSYDIHFAEDYDSSLGKRDIHTFMTKDKSISFIPPDFFHSHVEGYLINRAISKFSRGKKLIK
ncbi:hypothetical protein C0585_04525 [Candidatus Woesearchaeota archaeon]|nr:MAG: hypothetical protein C0585_04525 [Candidatus Woesearchaeota archaeon]